jgi:hypothetical protein
MADLTIYTPLSVEHLDRVFAFISGEFIQLVDQSTLHNTPPFAYLSRIEEITSSWLFSLIFRDILPVSSM